MVNEYKIKRECPNSDLSNLLNDLPVIPDISGSPSPPPSIPSLSLYISVDIGEGMIKVSYNEKSIEDDREIKLSSTD